MPSPDDDLLPRAFSGGLLRRLRPTDLDCFQSYRSIPELGRYQSWLPMSETEASAFLTQMSTASLFSPGEWIQLGIAEPFADRLIGDIGIYVANDARTAKIGITLEPDSQGRGIATAAVKEAIHLLFAATKVSQVFGITDHRNTPSIRLLERIGFRFKENRDTIFRGEPCCEKIYVLARIDPS
ncbi:MAG TPA: GNAT family N-acetyltransferase [Verrucomicrobiae bacterium]|nr:GNAT family N-acetyltransferase [Verrucomicrobiae bacterium]